MHRTGRYDHLPWCLVALILLAVCPSRGLASVYGYADLNTSSYTFEAATGTLTVGTPVALGTTSAVQIASPSGSEGMIGTFDPLQSYVGPPAGEPGENSFAPKGQTTPDYSRADSILDYPTSLRGIAELNLAGATNAAADSSYAFTIPFDITSGTGSARISFDFSRAISLINSGSPAGTVQGQVSYILSVHNADHSFEFSITPDVLNANGSQLTAGTFNDASSGSISITTPTLTFGSYTATITAESSVFGTGVPEPALAAPLAALALASLRRRR